MKYFVASVLLMLVRLANAGPPPVYPGEPLAASRYATALAEGEDCAVVWFYDAGHRWQRTGFYGNGEDCRKIRPEIVEKLGLEISDFPSWMLTTALAVKMSLLTHEEKDALWNAVFNIPSTHPDYAAIVAVHEAKDVGALALYKSVPVPTSAPPSGLVVQATPAYKVRRLINMAPVWVYIGTVPLGTPCDASQKFGDYYRVDRTLVKMSSKLADLPDSAWAKCDP